MLQLLSLLILLPLSVGVYPLSEQAARQEAAATTFDITTEAKLDSGGIKLNVDKALPALTARDFAWIVNGVSYQSSVQAQASGLTYLTLNWKDTSGSGYGKCDEVKANSYCQYRIPEGTELAEGYALANDYSFWFTHHSGGSADMGWVFQHGGADAVWNAEIPSIHIDSFDDGDSGSQEERWIMNFNISKKAGVYTETSWNASSILMAKGSADYALYEQSSASAGDAIHGYDQDMASANKDKTSGHWGLLIYYAALGITISDQDALSFYIPKGTLYGGFNENYSFYIDNEVYVDWTGTAFQGIFEGRHSYVDHPAKCGHPGNVEYYTCSRHEGEYFLLKDGKYQAATWSEIEVDVDHDYGTLIPEVPATCDADGVKAHYQCSVCGCLFVKEGDAYVEVTAADLVIAAHHTYVHVDEVPATSTSDGIREHYLCSVCHKLFLLIDEVYVEVSQEDLVIPASQDLVVIKGYPATCTEDGLTDGLKDAGTQAIVQAQLVIPALGHDFSGWSIVEQDDGSFYIHRVCSRCYEEETIAVNSDNGFTYEVVEPATATATGVGRYTSSTYGSFEVELPLASGSLSTNQSLLVTSAVLLAAALGLGIPLAIVFIKKTRRKKGV